MIYYSEKLGKGFETEEKCLEAEEAYEKEKAEKAAAEAKKKEERASRAEEIEKAFEELKDAQKKYNELLREFIKDYGSYHTTFRTIDDVPNIFKLFEPFRIF